MPNEILSKSLQGILFLVAASFVAAYVLVAIPRVAYPYELEWMEGAMVDHVAHILAGEPLYGPPALEFTPFGYAPVYFYLGAAVAEVLGNGFLALRLVSFACSLGSLVLLYGWVLRETKDRGAAFLSAALFAACFQIGGSFFDVARVDSVFVLLTLVTLLVTRRASTARGALAAGALFALLLFTKQIALLFAPAAGL